MASGDITQLSTVREFQTFYANDVSMATYDDSNMLMVYAGPSNRGQVQMFECNSPVYTMTAVGTKLQLSVDDGLDSACSVMTSSKALVAWRDNVSSDRRGVAMAVDIDASKNITAAGTRVTFATSINTSSLHRMAMVQITTYFYVAVYQDNTSDHSVKAACLQVNNSTWATTRTGTEQTLEAVGGSGDGVTAQRVDNSHIIVFWQREDGKGVSQVFSVNPATGAIAAIGTELVFHNSTSSAMYFPTSGSLGSDKFVAWWFSGISTAAKGRVFSVNTGTYAVTFAGAEYNVNTTGTGGYNLSNVVYDTNKVALYWKTSSGLGVGKMQTYKIDGGTYAITTDSALSPVTVEATRFTRLGSAKLKDNYVCAGWSGADIDGFTRAYYIEPTTVTPSTFLPQII